MKANGWIFNVNRSHDTFNDTCEPSRNPHISNTWYGWSTKGNAGSVKLYMKGSGSAKLVYGNCYESNNAGMVKVYLNNEEISQASSGEIKEIYFDYDHNAVLKLEEDWAIIKLHHIHWNCSSKIFLFWDIFCCHKAVTF